MATAKTKPVTEEPEVTEPATDEKPVTKADVVEIVKEAVSDLLPGKKGEEPEAETVVEDTTVMTARQEEQRTHNIVSEAIKAFKEEFAGEDSKKEGKKEPESEPGKKPTRWVERYIWGIE